MQVGGHLVSRILLTLVVAGCCTGSLIAQDGRKLALLVGVKNYEHAQLDPLKYSENDVSELGTLLKKSGFTTVVLCDSAGRQSPSLNPTCGNIKKQLAQLVKSGKRTDTIIVALSGHGLQFEDSPEPFFCPIDARPHSKKAERENLLAIGEIFKTLEESGIGTKLLLVDACRNDPHSARSIGGLSFHPPKETAVLFSCSKEQRAFEHGDLKHGIFFHYVIQGLKGAAKNSRNEVTWASLLDYVQDEVTTNVPKLIGDGARQEPNLVGNLSGKSPVLARVESNLTTINVPRPEPIIVPEPKPIVTKTQPVIPDMKQAPPPQVVPKNPLVGLWNGTGTLKNGTKVTEMVAFHDDGTFHDQIQAKGFNETDMGTYTINGKTLKLTSKSNGQMYMRTVNFDGPNKASVYSPELGITMYYTKEK